MLIVTHEMRLARDVSTRIFFMDEGGVYEDGTPKQIFENPQKERTQNFIYRIRNWECDISADIDIFAMMGSLEEFCIRQFMGRKAAADCQLAVEELVANIMLPILKEKPGVCAHLCLKAGEEGKNMLLEVDHRSIEGLDDLFSAQDDKLSQAILRKLLIQQPSEDSGISVFRID